MLCCLPTAFRTLGYVPDRYYCAFRKHWRAAWFQGITQINCVYMRISDQARKRIDITSIVLLIKPEHAIFGITVPRSRLLLLLEAS